LRGRTGMAEKQKQPPKRKPKRKMTKAEQSERFKETAQELEADESGKLFERAIATILTTVQGNRRKRAKERD
jgi:hypothetical protein